MTLTAKQEAFCQAIVAGNNQSDAYRLAYEAAKMKPATVHKRSAELMTNGGITGRIAELREPVIKKMQYDLEAAMTEAGEALEMARRDPDGKGASAMVAAVALRAKLMGLLVEKTEHRHGVLDDATTAELLEMKRQVQQLRLVDKRSAYP